MAQVPDNKNTSYVASLPGKAWSELDTWRLQIPKGSNVVPFWAVYMLIPKKKIGHNKERTTLEFLGRV